MLYVFQDWSSGGGVDRTPRTKASDEVVRVDGVGVGGGTGAVAASADTEALESETSTAADLGPRGTRLKASMVAFPLLCFILKLLNYSLNLSHLQIKIIEFCFHNPLQALLILSQGGQALLNPQCSLNQIA